MFILWLWLKGQNIGKMHRSNVWFKVSLFHFVIGCMENIYSASAPTFSSPQPLIGNFSSFHWPVRSWAGATRSQYGPSPFQHSESFQVQESNTWPSTKETSQHGRTTEGNCTSNIIDDSIKKAWGGEGVLFVFMHQCTQAFYAVLHWHIWGNVCKAEG